MIAHTNMPLDFKPKRLTLKPEMTIEEMDAYEAQEAELAKVKSKPKRLELKTEMTIEEMDAYEAQEAELANLKASLPADAAIAGVREAAGNIVKGIGRVADATDPRHLFMSDEEDKAFNEQRAKTGLQAIGDSIKAPRAEYELAKEKSPISTAVGEIGTEVASFLVPGTQAAKLPSVAGRIGAQAGVGATASGLVSSGKGNDLDTVEKDIALGGAFGAGGQALGEVISVGGSVLRSLFPKKEINEEITGKLSALTIDAKGKPSGVLADVLKDNNTDVAAFRNHLSNNFDSAEGQKLAKDILSKVGIHENLLSQNNGGVITETIAKSKLNLKPEKIKEGISNFKQQQSLYEDISNKLLDGQVGYIKTPGITKKLLTDINLSLKSGVLNTTQTNTLRRVKDAISSKDADKIVELRKSLSSSNSKFDKEQLEKVDRMFSDDLYDDIVGIKTPPQSKFAKLLTSTTDSTDDLVQNIIKSPNKFSPKDIGDAKDYFGRFDKAGLQGAVPENLRLSDKHGWSNLQKKMKESLINISSVEGELNPDLLVTNLNKFGKERLQHLMNKNEFELYSTIKALPNRTTTKMSRTDKALDFFKKNKPTMAVDAASMVAGGTPIATMLKSLLRTKATPDEKLYSAIDDLIAKQSKENTKQSIKYIAPIISTSSMGRIQEPSQTTKERK